MSFKKSNPGRPCCDCVEPGGCCPQTEFGKIDPAGRNFLNYHDPQFIGVSPPWWGWRDVTAQLYLGVVPGYVGWWGRWSLYPMYWRTTFAPQRGGCALTKWINLTYGAGSVWRYDHTVYATSVVCDPFSATFDLPSYSDGPVSIAAHTITVFDSPP